MPADGTGLRRIAQTNDPAYEARGQFAWSPDGTRIAFPGGAGGRTAIYVARVDGRRVVRVTRPGPNAHDTVPSWSPDGTRIAFARRTRVCGRAGDHPCYELDVVRVRDRRLRRLRSFDGPVEPDWSPRGDRIAFALSTYPAGGAYVIDADGRRIQRIAAEGSSVAWSPNGRWIAVGGTWIVRPDGRGLRRIRTEGGGASWSPDSRAIAVSDEGDVWVTAIDGSGQRRLTEGWRYGYGNYDPEWNPRGLPTAQIAGVAVSPANPTDSVVEGNVLRTTRPIARLSADGWRVAGVYGDAAAVPPQIAIEAWDVLTRGVTRFPRSFFIGCCAWVGSRGFAFAGDRLASTSLNSGGGIDTWTVSTATLSTPRPTDFRTTLQGWPGPCCSTPLEHAAGDGELLVVDGWGPCRISQSQPCANGPRFGGRLYRVAGERVTQIAVDPGALTVLSVDRDRILVDRENGALQLFRADGTPLYAITYGPARLVGAALEGNDIVVLTSEGLADYDAATGNLRQQRPVPADARGADVANGIAVYTTGTEIHLLRLGDGQDTVIRPEGSGPVLAQLEPPGLFYSYTVADATYPGLITFVPFDRLPR